MPIAMERFGLEAVVPAGIYRPVSIVFETTCHYCGFTIRDRFSRNKRCPKCGGSAWERYARATKLLPRADALRELIVAHESMRV